MYQNIPDGMIVARSTRLLSDHHGRLLLLKGIFEAYQELKIDGVFNPCNYFDDNFF